MVHAASSTSPTRGMPNTNHIITTDIETPAIHNTPNLEWQEDGSSSDTCGAGCLSLFPFLGGLLLGRREHEKQRVFQNVMFMEEGESKDEQVGGQVTITREKHSAAQGDTAGFDNDDDDAHLEEGADDDDDDVNSIPPYESLLSMEDNNNTSCDSHISIDLVSDLVLLDDDDAPTTNTKAELSIITSSPPPEDLLSQIVAVDCGMVNIHTTTNQTRNKRVKKHALRRVCIVNGHGISLLNETVRVPPDSDDDDDYIFNPYKSVLIQTLSKFLHPRINKCGDDLNVGVCAQEIKTLAASLMKDKIIVGHSVACDLGALGMMEGNHDPSKIRDTAFYPPFLRSNGKPQKLQFLVQQKLGKGIQPQGKFHCCMEDAVSALDLYKLVWNEWENSIASNDITQIQARNPKNYAPASSTPSMTANQQHPTKHESIHTHTNQANSKKSNKKKKKGKKAKPHQPINKSTKSQHILSNILYFVTFPLLETIRIIFDTPLFVHQSTLLLWRAGRLRAGYRVSPPPFFTPPHVVVATNHHQKKKKRRSRNNNNKQKQQYARWFESIFLILHVCLELYMHPPYDLAIATTMKQHDGNYDDDDDASNNNCRFAAANETLVIVLVGISLILAKNRITIQSRVCFGILTLYHFKMIQQQNTDIGLKKDVFVWLLDQWRTMVTNIDVLEWFRSFEFGDVSGWQHLNLFKTDSDIQHLLLVTIHMILFGFFALRVLLPVRIMGM